MNKRILLILLPVLIAGAVVFGIYQALKPRLQSWLLSQVNRISEEKLPVHLKIEKVDWSLLFPALELEGVQVSGKKDFQIPQIKVRRISASLDLLALLGGKIAVSSLLLEKPEAEVDLDVHLSSKSTPNSEIKLDEFFKLLKKIPLSRLGIRESSIALISEKMSASLLFGAADLLVVKGKDRLHLQFDLNDSIAESTRTGEIPFRLQGEAILNATTLDVSNLKLGTLNSMITAKGSLTDLPRLMIQPQGTLEFEAYSDLQQLAQAARNLFKFPNLSGKIDSSGRLEFTPQGKLEAGFKFNGQRLQIEQFQIGDIVFAGSIEKDALKIPKLDLTNEAGLVDIRDFELTYRKENNEPQISLKSKVSSELVDLNELLLRLGIGDLPLEVLIGADLQCAGPVYPNASLRCSGKATGQQLEVRTGEKYSDTLVLVDEFGADGEFTVSSRDVRYQAKVSAGADQGTSDGVISYQDGFKINYASPHFAFKNVRRLAGLKMEGAAEIQGSTQGNSDAATFTMKLKTKDFFFEDFYLGAPTGTLSYHKGILNFKSVEGAFPATTYKLDLDVDLNKKRIETKGQLPRFETAELMPIFARHFQMPISITGTGSATFHVEGPFQLGKLSYDINTTILKGEVVGETYDRAEFQLHSESGEMTIQKGLLTKNRNTIQLTGVSHPDGQINMKVVGQRLPVEDSENIAQLDAQISGLVDFETDLKGSFLNPDVNVKGRLYQLVVEELEFAESQVDLRFTRQSMNGTMDLFKGQLQAQLKIPFTDVGPFQMKVKAEKWNYTTLFALIGGGSLLGEYQASLSGDLDLASEKGGLWAASGRGSVKSLLLQRGGLSLFNKAPMDLTMTNGIASLSNFRIEGEETFFDLKGRKISHDDLNLRLEGKANLRLFQIFVPFLEEFAGQANIAADISGPLLKPEVLGNAAIRETYVKIKGFPHPFEKTQAEIQFSQSRILINSFSGNLAGGTFRGDGSVVIEGPQNLPTSIKAQLQNVNLNVPDGVRTNGDADVIFSGNWFPFTLSGTYHVQGGFVDKELTEESSGTNLKQSSYLPKIILQSAFEPVLLDLNIILEKPLVIKNSLVDGAVNGNISVHGPPASPALGGHLVAEKGTKAIFRDKIFEVQSANVRFTGESDINPELYVSARSRISEYDINMLIQGNAKNPAVKLSSVPPLSDQDLISLIALGVTSQTLEKNVQVGNKNRDDTMKGVAAGVLTQFEPVKKLQKTTGVEIQFSTSSDDARNASVQRVTLSKKISEKVRASATQASGSQSSSNEYSLRYNLTDSLSAIGRYEDRKYNPNAGGIEATDRESQSILGIDLEFKKEFK